MNNKCLDCSFRLASISDALQVYNWRSSPEVVRGMATTLPENYNKHLFWFERELANSARQMFILKYRDYEIGFFSFYEIDWEEGVATFSWYIGETAFRGIGLSRCFLDLLLKYFFSVLKLKSLNCTVKKDNLIALNLYLGSDFTLVADDESYFYLVTQR